MKKIKSNYLIYSLLLSTALLFSCMHPLVNGNSVDSAQSKNNSQAIIYHRGAATEKELANVLFAHLQGKISFDSLLHFIPDKAELKTENSILKKDSSAKTAGMEFTANVSAIKNALATALQRAQTVGISLPDANLDDVRIQVNEDTPLNSKQLTLLGSQNYKNFKVYAHVLKIGAYWYLDKFVVFETAN